MVVAAAASAEPFLRSREPPIGTPEQKIYSVLNYHSLKPFTSALVELTFQETEKSLYLVLVLYVQESYSPDSCI